MKIVQFEEHYVNRSNWLRAAILGANDGILSTASIIIGVAAASQTRDPIVLEEELLELAKIYVQRGLDKDLAHKVAEQLTEHDALGAHARDELGINEITQAKPLEAAFASGAAFVFGGALPVLVALFADVKQMVYLQYVFAIVFLIILGTVAARAGGSSIKRAILRVTFWGTIAMGITAYIGSLFGVNGI